MNDRNISASALVVLKGAGCAGMLTEEIAEELGIAPSTTRAALGRLQKAGAAFKERETGEEPQRPRNRWFASPEVGEEIGDMTEARWQKLLMRWSPVGNVPEGRLICAFIATVIADQAMPPGFMDERYDQNADWARWFFGQPEFAAYCAAVGLNPTFVREAVAHAAARVAEMRQAA